MHRDVKKDASYPLVHVLQLLRHVVFTLLWRKVVAWFSRQREFRADAGGARLAGREKMINALAALKRTVEGEPSAEEAHPAIAALRISSSTKFMRLFASHPPLDERIARLRAAA